MSKTFSRVVGLSVWRLWATSDNEDAIEPGQRFTAGARNELKSWIGDLRCLPITRMIDGICVKSTTLHASRRERAEAIPDIALLEKPRALLQEQRNVMATLTINARSNAKFEVTSAQRQRYKVDLTEMTCSCGYWQDMGLSVFPRPPGVDPHRARY